MEGWRMVPASELQLDQLFRCEEGGPIDSVEGFANGTEESGAGVGWPFGFLHSEPINPEQLVWVLIPRYKGLVTVDRG